MINLPDTPAPNGCEVSVIDFGGYLTPPLGGTVQRLNRPGNRFAIKVDMPPMYKDIGRPFISALIKAKRAGLRMKFPLQDFDPGDPGTPVVNGTGQLGITLNIRGLGVYKVEEGQFFSIEQGGQHFLYMFTQTKTSEVGGTLSVEIEPPLRKATVDGAALHIEQPMIEGYVLGQEWAWQLALDNLDRLSFSIHERA